MASVMRRPSPRNGLFKPRNAMVEMGHEVTTASQLDYASTKIQLFNSAKSNRHKLRYLPDFDPAKQPPPTPSPPPTPPPPPSPPPMSPPRAISLILMTVLHYANIWTNLSLCSWFYDRHAERLEASQTGHMIPYDGDLFSSFEIHVAFIFFSWFIVGVIIPMCTDGGAHPRTPAGKWLIFRSLTRTNLLWELGKSFWVTFWDRKPVVARAIKWIKLSEVMFECVPLASVQVYTWIRYGELRISLGAATSTDCLTQDCNAQLFGSMPTTMPIAPYNERLQVSALIAVISAALTIAHYWEALDETNLPAMACKRSVFFGRCFLVLYCGVDAAIHVLVFALGAHAFRAGIWGIVVVVMLGRLAMWVNYFKDPDENKGVDPTENRNARALQRRERIRTLTFKFATGLPFAPALLCHDFFVEEETGVEAGDVRTYRPLLVQMLFSLFETWAVTCLQCLVGFHPGISVGCTCNANANDIYLRETCQLEGELGVGNRDDVHGAMGLGPYGYYPMPLIVMGGLWGLKALSLAVLSCLRSSQLRQRGDDVLPMNIPKKRRSIFEYGKSKGAVVVPRLAEQILADRGSVLAPSASRPNTRGMWGLAGSASAGPPATPALLPGGGVAIEAATPGEPAAPKLAEYVGDFSFNKPHKWTPAHISAAKQEGEGEEVSLGVGNLREDEDEEAEAMRVVDLDDI
jgi:hypothetical protein